MANGSDGSLVIDTELDNEGFEKGSDKLLSSVDNLANQVNTLGSEMKNAFTGITSILQSMATASNNAASGASDSAQQATQAATAAQQAAEAQAQQAAATKSATAATGAYDKELAKLQKQINTAKNNLSGYYAELEEIGKSTDEMLQDVSDGPAAADQVDNILEIEKIQIEALNEEYKTKLTILHQLEEQYRNVAAARDAAERSAAAEFATSNADISTGDNQASKVQSLEEKLAALREQIAAVQSSLDEYRQKVADVRQATDDALKGVADGPDAESQVDELLANEEQQLEALNQEYLENLRILDEFRSEHSRVAAALIEERQTMQQASGLSGAIRALSRAFRQNLSDENAVDAAATRLVSVFGEVGKSAKKATKNLLILPFAIIASGAKKAVSNLKKFCVQAKKTSLSANEIAKALTRIKRILISRFKERFITVLFRNIGEALKQLALFDSQFNTTMSNIENSSNQLSGNVAAVVGNVITALEPAVMAIIDLMNKAVTAINQFFAALNGKSTYSAAIKGNAKYAESAETAAAAQKKFNAELYSFDELNRQSSPEEATGTELDDSTFQYQELPVSLSQSITGWINDLKRTWSSGDWYGVGEVLADGLNSTLQVVDNWINTKLRPKGVEWADRTAEILNGLVDNVNWSLLGKTVADGCNTIIDTVNAFFTKFKAKNFGSGIGATIKSWFDNIDWTLAGQTFANGWNAIIHLIEGIVTAPGIWASIGQSIGTFVKSWFTNIDLDGIATSIIATFNGVTDLINAFLAQNPFEGVAEKIYSAINRVLHEVNWAALGQAIGNLFISVLKNLVSVVQQIDWVQVGYAVGQALSNVNWGEIFANVAKFIGAALKSMFEFLGGMIKGDGLGVLIAGFTLLAGNLAVKLAGAIFKQPLQQALTSVIADLLTHIIGNSGIGGWGASILAAGRSLLGTIVSKIATISTTVLPAIFSTLGRIVASIVATIGGWPTVIIAAGAAVIAALVVWIKNGGGEVIQGFIDGVKEKWEDVKQALKDFADLWITGFKSLFGIHSPSTVMAEQGGYIVAGLLEGLSRNWSAITEFLSNGASEMLSFLSEKWQDVGTDAQEKWDIVRSNIVTAFSNAKNEVHNNATQLWGALNSKWSEIYTGAQTAWSNVYSTISTSISNARSFVVEIAGNMYTNLSGAFSGIVTNAQTAWGDLQTITHNKFSTLQQNVLRSWINLRTNLNNVKWNNVGHNLVAGLNNGVAGAWGGFMNNVSNMVNNLIRRIKSLFGIHSPSKVFAEIGAFLDAGLIQGIESGERGLLTTAKNIATAVTDGMTPDTPNVQMNVDSVVGSMQAIISSLGSLAVTFQTIANALTSIGGFTLPNIAAGTVVPYQTKVATNAAPTSAEGGVEAYLLGILSELQALSRSMRNGDGSHPQNISIVIGGREVFQVVVDENNRAIRTTGKSPLKV